MKKQNFDKINKPKWGNLQIDRTPPPRIIPTSQLRDIETLKELVDEQMESLVPPLIKSKKMYFTLEKLTPQKEEQAIGLLDALKNNIERLQSIMNKKYEAYVAYMSATNRINKIAARRSNTSPPTGKLIYTTQEKKEVDILSKQYSQIEGITEIPNVSFVTTLINYVITTYAQGYEILEGKKKNEALLNWGLWVTLQVESNKELFTREGLSVLNNIIGVIDDFRSLVFKPKEEIEYYPEGTTPESIRLEQLLGLALEKEDDQTENYLARLKEKDSTAYQSALKFHKKRAKEEQALLAKLVKSGKKDYQANYEILKFRENFKG